MSTRLRLTRVLFVCLTALVLATFLQSSDALERPLKVCGFRPELLARNNVQQASSLPPSAPVSEPLTLPTDWLARKKIETAVDYIKEQQWPEAVRLLQAILDAREDTFLQVEEKDTDGRPILRYTSARVEAERLVGSLPPAGMEYYQLHAGRLAADRLKEARNDAHLLAEVARRYFHTKAGAEALTLLGVHHLDRGRSGLAADCFRRLLHRERTEQLTPLTLFQAAMAFHQAGDLVHEELAWRRLVAQAPGGLRLGRQVVSLERLRKELDRMPRPAAAADWPLFRGNPARTGCGDGDIPWLEPRWQIATAERPETRRCIETGLRYQEGIREPVMPAFFPVTAGNKVIYRSHGGVAAVDVRTGHELWKSPLPLSFEGILRDPGKKVQVEQWMRLYGAFGLISSTGGNAGPAGGAGIGGIPPGNLGGVPSGSGSLGGLPTNAWASTLLFNNCVQGTLSTDHRRVYAVEDLPLPPPPELIQDIMSGTPRHFGPLRDHLYFNRLRAIDLETGKIIWEVGGRGDGELADCYFLGPPLPLDGRLHVLIEKKSELRLVCLGAERGNILWTQTLANYRDHILLDARRRVQAAHLSYDDGILVCSTNAGMLFGVELLTRSLLWVYSYRTPAAPDAAPPPPVPLQAVSTSWRTSAPILHGGKVVFTAPDADAVHCLHLRDGLPVWKAGRTDDDLYLAGVFKDRVLLVGKQNCRALSLADGKPLWQLATGTPSGQGVGAGPVYFLPLQKGAVCAIDVERGAVAGSAESRSGEVPGNLILHDGDLLSQTALQLTAYPQLRVRLGQINERLARDPCDPSALADRGALRLDQGDLPGAAADLRAALAGQPPAELLLRVQAKLFDALTQWLRRDFAAAEKYLDEYHQLSEVPIPENAPAEQVWKLRQERDRRLAAYYVVLARGREQQGRLSEALAAYRRLHDLARDGQPIPAADNPSGRVRPDVWVEGRTAALLARASPEQRRAVEEQIDREWRALRATADTDALERFVALFGSACAAGREARLELAERLTQDHDRGRFLEAELLLLPLCEQRDDPVLAARAVETLARLLLRKGLPEDAMHYYRILARDFAPVVVRGGQTGADLVNALTADKRLLAQVHEGPPPWVPGRIKAVDEPVNAPPRLTALVLLPEGEMPPSYRGRQLLLDVNSSRLVIADQRTGATVWSRGLALGPHRHHLRGLIPSERSLSFHLVGHLAVLHLGHMVCAVDLIERRMLWQRPLLEAMISPEQVAFRSGPGNSQRAWAIGEAGQPAGVSRLAVVGPAVVCVQMPRRLVALDPARGDVLWTRTDLGPTVEFFSDQEHVYAVQPDVGSTHVLRARDGTVREAPPFAPEYRDRLAVVEGKLLVGQIDPEGNCTLRLYDVASGKDVWKRTFPANAIFLRAPDAELAGVLDPTGKFVVFEAATGKELVKGAVDPKHLSNVEEVYLLHDRTQFYLAFHGPINPATRIAEEPVPNLLNSRPGVPVNGMLYAFNRNTGELSWANRLTGQFIVREHLADLPVLLCTARYPRRKADGNLVMVAATCSFDKQTGKLLYNKEVVEPEHGSPGLPPTLFHTLHVDPRTGTIELIAPRLKVHHFPRTRE